MESPALDEREKAAVLWAEHVTRNTARHRDDVFDVVRAQFTDAEIVELTFMSGLFNMFNRFMDSLHISIESQPEIDRIKSSLHLDPERLRSYLHTIAESWPAEFPEPPR